MKNRIELPDWITCAIYPGDPAPDLPFYDDDWFRFYHAPDDPDDIRGYEVHELSCTHAHCAYRDEPCAWHPLGCDCSLGECQY